MTDRTHPRATALKEDVVIPLENAEGRLDFYRKYPGLSDEQRDLLDKTSIHLLAARLLLAQLI